MSNDFQLFPFQLQKYKNKKIKRLLTVFVNLMCYYIYPLLLLLPDITNPSLESYLLLIIVKKRIT